MVSGKRTSGDSIDSSPLRPAQQVQSNDPARSGQTRRIALFGGSFNPPHQTHRRITRAALDQLPIAQLWVLPCGNHPLKDNRDLAPATDRFALCELAFADLDSVVVSGLDLHGDRPAYTVELLERVRDQFPEVGRPFWLLGADNLPQLPLWKDYRRLFELADMVVYPRRGYELDASVVEQLEIEAHHRQQLLASTLAFQPDAVSSTAIRQALASATASTTTATPDADEANLAQWLEPAVWQAIRDRGLYREDR